MRAQALRVHCRCVTVAEQYKMTDRVNVLKQCRGYERHHNGRLQMNSDYLVFKTHTKLNAKNTRALAFHPHWYAAVVAAS